MDEVKAKVLKEERNFGITVHLRSGAMVSQYRLTEKELDRIIANLWVDHWIKLNDSWIRVADIDYFTSGDWTKI